VFNSADVTAKVRSTWSASSSPNGRQSRYSPASVSVRLRVAGRPGPPTAGSVKGWVSAGRWSPRCGRPERVSEVPQSVDTSASATGVRQAVSHRTGTGYQTTLQTHLQGNHDVICTRNIPQTSFVSLPMRHNILYFLAILLMPVHRLRYHHCRLLSGVTIVLGAHASPGRRKNCA